MNDIRRDPASYRDRSGHVYADRDKIYRTVTEFGADAFAAIASQPVIARLQSDNRLIDFRQLPASDWPSSITALKPAVVVEHPKLPVISYPYEWSFAALRAAALAHLDLHMDLLNDGLTLTDASAYNVQFVNSRPIFIDVLSIRPYLAGEYWLAHNQFLEQFLNPLLLEARCGVSFANFLRSALEGIPSQDLNRLLPLKAKLAPSTFFDVVLPSWLGANSKRLAEHPGQPSRRALPPSAFRRLLLHLRHVIEGLSPTRRSAWAEYSVQNTYSENARRAKEAAVREFAQLLRPRQLIDIGCNDGTYSRVALEAGAASAIGLETDRSSLDKAFTEAQRRGLAFFPLAIDFANPSPGQGWRGIERRSFLDRISPDATLGLAVTHHLAIGRNLPLDEVIEDLVSLAPAGLIEFIPKSDPMVDFMLQRRHDIFAEYNEQQFRSGVLKFARLVREFRLPDSGRVLFWYERTARPGENRMRQGNGPLFL
jgi:ribosomal protein L11 methylase PrmA